MVGAFNGYGQLLASCIPWCRRTKFRARRGAQTTIRAANQSEGQSRPPPKPESTEGGRRVSILKWPEGALLNRFVVAREDVGGA